MPTPKPPSLSLGSFLLPCGLIICLSFFLYATDLFFILVASSAQARFPARVVLALESAYPVWSALALYCEVQGHCAMVERLTKDLD